MRKRSLLSRCLTYIQTWVLESLDVGVQIYNMATKISSIQISTSG